MEHLLEPIFEGIATSFEVAGVVAVVIGTLYTLVMFLARLRKRSGGASIDYLRLELGRSIVLGLEFFVAGDIVRTVITPDYYKIGLLSILVIIRTVLTYFLNKEIAMLRSQDS